MFPAYHVPAVDFMEVVFTIAELHPDATQMEIEKFSESGVSDRKVRESIKIGREIGLVEGESQYNIPERFRSLFGEHSHEDWDVILHQVLLQYRPFRSYLSYLDRGYPSRDAAQKVAVLYDLESEPTHIQDKFETLGGYTGILEMSGDSVSVTASPGEVSPDVGEPVHELRDALESRVEIVLYLGETIGEDIVASFDEGIEEDLITAFLEHPNDPRNSLTAAGRALEDYLKQLSRENGRNVHEIASGVGDLGNRLKGEGLIAENQKKRILSISELRNRGGGHGQDTETGERWGVRPELALQVAMETTLLIRSISQFDKDGTQIL